MAKRSQEPKHDAKGAGASHIGRVASQEGVVAIQCVQNGHLIYKTAQFDIQSPSALVRGEQRVKSKVRMRIPYLTNDKSLVKGARLLVKGSLLAELEDDLT